MEPFDRSRLELLTLKLPFEFDSEVLGRNESWDLLQLFKVTAGELLILFLLNIRNQTILLEIIIIQLTLLAPNKYRRLFPDDSCFGFPFIAIYQMWPSVKSCQNHKARLFLFIANFFGTCCYQFCFPLRLTLGGLNSSQTNFYGKSFFTAIQEVEV